MSDDNWNIVDFPTATTVPYLTIHVPLEGSAELNLICGSWEDEIALRGWLRRTEILDDLALVLVRLLDELDACDAKEAA